jgi:hypothetical protein
MEKAPVEAGAKFLHEMTDAVGPGSVSRYIAIGSMQRTTV